ncbi:MAG TPA: HypC/HybG/HupF family hydrogenase formation chaperone [Thermoproteota archaeon]|nr:HypC/HybG/HupF family hydrogenase formation chaperone [Thermoproteota archaeon]
MCLAIPCTVEKVDGLDAIATVAGVRRAVRLDLVEGVRPGDVVLVHSGFAIQKLNQEDAAEVIKTIVELGEKSGW